ncbi:hypothetical protein VCBJG01_3100 [Vibrio cholerae BJG-01]|nr:hypothetical protein VCBJG01_3100 [Vibrio cholerae BJG-01]
MKHQGLLAFSGFETAEHSTISTKLASGKIQQPNCATSTLKADFSEN